MQFAELKKKLLWDLVVPEKSHRAGLALGAMAPLEEWLPHLAKLGYHYVLVERGELERMEKIVKEYEAEKEKENAK